MVPELTTNALDKAIVYIQVPLLNGVNNTEDGLPLKDVLNYQNSQQINPIYMIMITYKLFANMLSLKMLEELMEKTQPLKI